MSSQRTALGSSCFNIIMHLGKEVIARIILNEVRIFSVFALARSK